MRKLIKISVLAFAAISFTFFSCTSQPADKTSPDDMVQGTDGGLDSAGIQTDTAGVR